MTGRQPDVRVRIDDVRLDGVVAPGEVLSAEALEAALAMLFADRLSAGHLSGDRSIDQVVVGERQPVSGVDVGTRAARAILRGVTG